MVCVLLLVLASVTFFCSFEGGSLFVRNAVQIYQLSPHLSLSFFDILINIIIGTYI